MKRIVLALALAAFAHITGAQVAPGQLTLTLQQTTRAGGNVDVSLTWGTEPNASRCVSSGGWTGSRSVDRTNPLVIANVVPPRDFTLTCYWDDNDVRLTWVAPTQNVDGTPLTNLAGYRILFSNNPANLDQVITIDDPAVTQRVVQPLAAGVWHFAMVATNSEGTDSDRTATIAHTLGSASIVRTVTATANRPRPPTGLTAESVQ